MKKFRPDVETDSAGVNPVISISESARRYLAREDADRYLKHTSERLDEKPVETYDLIVAMEQRHRDAILSRCPECADKIFVWNIEDPYFMPSGSAEKIFDQIRERVRELADSL